MKTQDYVKQHERLKELEAEVARLRVLLKRLSDHELVMQQGGTSDVDRACRVMDKQAAEVARLRAVVEDFERSTALACNETDEAREAARWLWTKMHWLGGMAYIAEAEQRWPWLEDSDDG